MRVYISVPSFGGMIETRTAANIMSCLNRAMHEKIITDYNINYSGDSLIHRIRNAHAKHAMDLGFDKLFTIDSDIEFTWEHFKRILTSSHDVIGGSYPLKCFPVVVNFNPLQDKGTEFLKTNRGYDYDAFMKFKEKYADANGIAPVRHLPTGFLCVSMAVLKKLAEKVETYWTFAQESGERRGYFHFYPSEIVNYDLESEDWGLCRLIADAGFPIHFDTEVICGHIGKHIYRFGQVYGEVDLSSKTSDD